MVLSQKIDSHWASARKQWLTFGILMSIPLIIGGLRLATGMTPDITTDAFTPDVIATKGLLSESTSARDKDGETTLFVVAFSEDSPYAVANPEEQQTDDSIRDATSEPKETALSSNENDTQSDAEEAAETGEGENNKGKTTGPGDELACCDANSDFADWSNQLDDEIRSAVISAITNKLSHATENLDRQQERLERLQVETELYRRQIQHLRNRLKEWDDH